MDKQLALEKEADGSFEATTDEQPAVGQHVSGNAKKKGRPRKRQTDTEVAESKVS